MDRISNFRCGSNSLKTLYQGLGGRVSGTNGNTGSRTEISRVAGEISSLSQSLAM